MINLDRFEFSKSILLSMFLVSCGSKSQNGASTSAPTATVNQLVGDAQLSGSVVNAGHSDVLSSLSDQGTSTSALTMISKDSSDDSSKESAKNSSEDSSKDSSKDSDDDSKSTVDRSCVVSGQNAVVTVKSTIDRSQTNTSKSGTVTVSRKRTGTSTMTRTWSRTDGTAVTCGTTSKFAKVDFKNPSGLKLDIDFERLREESKTYTGPKLTQSSSRSFKASGKRSITWSSNDTTDDTSTTFIRNKKIAIKDVTETLTMTDKDGSTVTSTLVINTTVDKPLSVKVERNTSDQSIVSKTIVSGELVSKKDSDAVVTTNYNNVKMTYSSSECKPVSGSATIVITDSTGATVKSMDLSFDSSGEATLKDHDSGTEVEGFSLDGCDSEDLHLDTK